MIHPTLFVVPAASLIAAALFLHIGIKLGRRQLAPEVRFAGFAFIVSWICFAFEAVTDGLRTLIGVTGHPDLDLYMTLAYTKIIAAAGAIWGFGVYVAYLWTGRTRPWSWILALFAASHAAYFLWGTLNRGPVGVEVHTWVTRLVFEGNGPTLSPVRGTLTLLFFFLPNIVLAAYYLIVMRRVRDRTQRFRVGAVAVAILLFHIVNIVLSNPDTPGDSPVFLAIAALTIVAALIAHFGYAPPAWLQMRYGIRDLEQRGPAASPIVPSERTRAPRA